MKSKIILICDVCLSRNYHIIVPKDHSTRLVLKKYCPTCNKHEIHKETI